MSMRPASPHVLHPGMKTGVRLPYLRFLSTAESSYCRGVEDCSEEGLGSRLWNEHMHNTSQRKPVSVKAVTSLSSDCPYAHSTAGNFCLFLICPAHMKLLSQKVFKEHQSTICPETGIQDLSDGVKFKKNENLTWQNQRAESNLRRSSEFICLPLYEVINV